MGLPAGGFFTLGAWLLLFNRLRNAAPKAADKDDMDNGGDLL